MYIVDASPEIIKNNPYATAKIEKFLTKKEMGFDDIIMGGNCKRIAKIKGEEKYLLLGKTNCDTIAVAFPEQVKPKVENEVEESNTCEGCGKTFSTAQGLIAHKRFCKK